MSADDGSSLRRALGLPALTAYGVGGMLGGGIYALVGEVAGQSGHRAWLAFAAAMLVAAPTAFCYAELVTRFPRSGGESIFVRRGFGSDWGALLMGWTVIFSGIASMGTLAHAFHGYLEPLLGDRGLPRWMVALGFLLALAAVNAWGIRFTSHANILATGIELSGLLIVVFAGLAVVAPGLAGQDEAGASTAAPLETSWPWLAVLHASTIAFYAYIGFEDMVNVAEEVRNPRRAFPRAIPLALVVVGTVYMAVTFLATATVPPPALAESPSPLLEVVRRGAGWFPSPVFSVIALFAVANTALLNFVMASRLAYGMADDGLLPPWLATVHPGRRTPIRAIVVVLLIAAGLTLTGTLQTLAGTTSLLILAVFFVVDGTLLWIRSGRGQSSESEGHEPEDVFRVPLLVPVLGMLFAAVLAPFAPVESILTAVGVVAAGGILILLRRLRWAG